MNDRTFHEQIENLPYFEADDEPHLPETWVSLALDDTDEADHAFHEEVERLLKGVD